MTNNSSRLKASKILALSFHASEASHQQTYVMSLSEKGYMSYETLISTATNGHDNIAEEPRSSRASSSDDDGMERRSEY